MFHQPLWMLLIDVASNTKFESRLSMLEIPCLETMYLEIQGVTVVYESNKKICSALSAFLKNDSNNEDPGTLVLSNTCLHIL